MAIGLVVRSYSCLEFNSVVIFFVDKIGLSYWYNKSAVKVLAVFRVL
jgi:hypothetical protein